MLSGLTSLCIKLRNARSSESFEHLLQQTRQKFDVIAQLRTGFNKAVQISVLDASEDVDDSGAPAVYTQILHNVFLQPV